MCIVNCVLDEQNTDYVCLSGIWFLILMYVFDLKVASTNYLDMLSW